MYGKANPISAILNLWRYLKLAIKPIAIRNRLMRHGSVSSLGTFATANTHLVKNRLLATRTKVGIGSAVGGGGGALLTKIYTDFFDSSSEESEEAKIDSIATSDSIG